MAVRRKGSWAGLRVRFTLAAFIAAMSAIPVASATGAGRWEVTMIKGDVTVNGVTFLAIGSSVVPGTSIETGRDGKLVLSRNGDTVTVFPSSKMSVPYRRNDEEPGILQNFGRLLFRMESRESRDFKVQTPYLAAAVKGTTFTVSVEPDGADVAVSQGSVQVTALSSGFTTMVGAGMTASVDSDDSETVEVSEFGSETGSSASSGQETAETENSPDESWLVTRTLNVAAPAVENQ